MLIDRNLFSKHTGTVEEFLDMISTKSKRRGMVLAPKARTGYLLYWEDSEKWFMNVDYVSDKHPTFSWIIAKDMPQFLNAQMNLGLEILIENI